MKVQDLILIQISKILNLNTVDVDNVLAHQKGALQSINSIISVDVQVNNAEKSEIKRYLNSQ